MKTKDIAALFNRAAAALEDLSSLSDTERDELAEDLVIAAYQVKAEDSGWKLEDGFIIHADGSRADTWDAACQKSDV